MEVKINMSKETLFDLLLITERRIDNYANRIDPLVKRGAVNVANSHIDTITELKSFAQQIKTIIYSRTISSILYNETRIKSIKINLFTASEHFFIKKDNISPFFSRLIVYYYQLFFLNILTFTQ
jgi:hypothetical protein